MVRLSPPRFYVEISCYFDITCINGRPNLILVIFSNFALFSLEYEENHCFFAIIRRKNYLLANFINSFFFSKLDHTHTNSKLGHFYRFQPKTRNMIFFNDPRENFRKKRALIFFVGWKESQWNTDQKVGLRQHDILTF
jgi:hypothetical protein